MGDWYFLIFFLCCLGHALIWVRVLNWMHGIRSQAPWTHFVRLGLHLILSGLPLLWFCLFRFSAPPAFWHSWPMMLRYLFEGYLWVIGLMGLIVFPYVWVSYLLRREPASTSILQRDVKNIAHAIGKRPTGSGPRGWKANLPYNQAYEVEMIERDLVLPDLPKPLHGLRILHLSDTHFCGRPGQAYFEYVFKLCNQRPFDVLALTGDLIDDSDHYHWLEMFSLMKPREARWAITGNHDALYDLERVRRMMRTLHFQVFSGIAVKTEIHGVPLIIAGNEAPWNDPIPNLSAFEGEALYRIALVHSPDQYSWAVKEKFNLVLAGHNHGGQIRIPGFGSIFVPSKTGRSYDQGVFQKGNTVMHVSKGLSGGHPVRYFCRPEATWLTLRCQ